MKGRIILLAVLVFTMCMTVSLARASEVVINTWGGAFLENLKGAKFPIVTNVLGTRSSSFGA